MLQASLQLGRNDNLEERQCGKGKEWQAFRWLLNPEWPQSSEQQQVVSHHRLKFNEGRAQIQSLRD